MDRLYEKQVQCHQPNHGNYHAASRKRMPQKKTITKKPRSPELKEAG